MVAGSASSRMTSLDGSTNGISPEAGNKAKYLTRVISEEGLVEAYRQCWSRGGSGEDEAMWDRGRSIRLSNKELNG